MHCNLRLVDSIEEIGRSDANIDWSSDDEEDRLIDIKAASELLRTFTNFIFPWTFLNFILNVLNFTTMIWCVALWNSAPVGGYRLSGQVDGLILELPSSSSSSRSSTRGSSAVDSQSGSRRRQRQSVILCGASEES